MAPMCPHCDVQMWLYETVQKTDGPYGRYECRVQVCPKCHGKPCTEKIGQFIVSS